MGILFRFFLFFFFQAEDGIRDKLVTGVQTCALPIFGVRGFLISCATCLAISRQAPSRSLLAKAAALSSSLLTILLYPFTSSPISSLRFHSISSFALARFTCFILSLITENDLVIRLVMNSAITPAIRKINALRLIMVTRKLEISWFSSLCERK